MSIELRHMTRVCMAAACPKLSVTRLIRDGKTKGWFCWEHGHLAELEEIEADIEAAKKREAK